MTVKQYIAHWSGPLSERDIVFPSIPEEGTEWLDTVKDAIYRVEAGVWRGYKPVMIYRGAWVQDTYQPGDVVHDNGWTMIANKETDQRPSPQPIGNPAWVSGLGVSPSWTADTASTSEVITGQRYFVSANGFITAGRVWIPTLGANLEFMVATVIDPGSPASTITLNGIAPSTTGWFYILQGQDIIWSGSEFDYLLIVRDHSTSTSFTGNWNYLRPNNETAPLTGEISHANKEIYELQIYSTDDDAGDRTAELATVKAGDTIEGAGVLWTVISSTVVGSYTKFVVSPAFQGSPTGVQNFTFTVYGSATVDFVRIADHYISNPNVDGVYSDTGYDNAVTNNHAYGADIQVQEAAISEDWDMVAYSG